MDALMSPIVWVIVAPLLAATLCFVCGPRAGAAIRIVAIAVIVLATLGLIGQVLAQGAWRQALGDWQAPLGIVFHADGLGVFMLAVNTAVAVPISIYAMGYLPRQHETDRDASGAFWPLWFFLWLALSCLYLSADLFNLYIALEVLGVAAVALVALAGGAALEAAIRYVLVTLFASLAYLLGVALLYAQHGLLDMALLGERIAPGPATWAALVLMTLGLALKTAVFPLHFWLPPAHANALGPISAALSALVVKGSFYLLLRLWITVFPAVVTPSLAQAVGVLGMIAILWGSVQALRQERLKMLVAYSTVAQMGYLLLAFPLAMHRPAGAAAWLGALYFAAAHACAKGAMFLAAGTIKHVTHDDRIAGLTGLGGRLPWTTFALALAGITLIGLPPTGGFLAKWQLLGAAIETGQWAIVAVIVAGTLLAAGYVIPVLARALGEPDAPAPRARVPLAMELGTFALATAGVLLGFLSWYPLHFLEIGEPFAAVRGAGGGP